MDVEIKMDIQMNILLFKVSNNEELRHHNDVDFDCFCYEL